MPSAGSIAAAALSREDSRGAHFREDFPDTDKLEHSTFTVVTQQDGDIALRREPVVFSRVQPGQTLIVEAPSGAGTG